MQYLKPVAAHLRPNGLPACPLVFTPYVCQIQHFDKPSEVVAGAPNICGFCGLCGCGGDGGCGGALRISIATFFFLPAY
jgi:hypothetical protein